ncbi:MAG TPA: CARDB domain-containing protein [Solirubrobacteraceae bacterium]|jgi:hypothetical protein
MQARIVAVTAITIAAGAAPVAQAAAKPDLAVQRVTVSAASVAAGGTLTVRDVVANVAGRRAKAVRVGYWLSRDRRRDRADVALGGRTQKPLAGRRRGRGRRKLTVPGTAQPGAYFLLACADPTRKVKERSERNNCRASRGRVTVSTPGGLGGPPVPGPGPAGPGGGAAGGGDGSGGGAGGGAPAGDIAEVDFPLAADPLTVSHTLETGRGVTQRVESFGGTITATAANGTTYALELPNGALLSGQDITLTPVSAVNGSPLSGGLIGAVEIKPHGLELLKPATLTITPSGGAGPVAGQTAFLSHGAGEDFHLYPLAPEDGLKLHLTHFSTPGVAQATDADRQVVLAHPPARHRAQYEQLMSELLRDARIAQEADENAGLPADQMAAIFLGYYNDIVLPLVEQAYTDDTVASRAIAELLSWARNVDLVGLDEHRALSARRDAVMPNVVKILENAVQKGYAHCVDDHDLDYVVRLIALARAGALLGAPLGEDALDKAQRCANFELKFDSLITQHGGFTAPDGRTSDLDASWHVKAAVPIDITGIAHGAMTWAGFSYSLEMTYPCGSSGGTLRYVTTGTATRPDTDFLVLLSMDLNLREPGTPPPANRDILVRLFSYDDIGETYDTNATSWCGDTPPQDEPPVDEERWREAFTGFHVEDYEGFRGWQVGTPGSDLIATKRYDQTDPGDGTAETTTLELWHKPLK